MPYTEKINMLASQKTAASNFIRMYQNKLRYFGDLRNQLVHGFRIDRNHYVLASDHAVYEIKHLYEEMRTPTSVANVFRKEVYTCRVDDNLQTVIQTMKDELNTHVPVYDMEGKFVNMLSESTIAYWAAEQMADDQDHIVTMKVGDIPLENSNDLYMFVDEHTSIYDIEQLFANSSEEKKRLGAVFVTETGDTDEPLVGIVTAMDLPKLADHFVL